MSHPEHPPKQDLRAVALNKVENLLRRYSAGGEYDHVTDQTAIDTLETAVDELEALQGEISGLMEPGPLVGINQRISALERRVQAVTGKSQRILPERAPDAVAELAETAKQVQAQRTELFAKAERLYRGLPNVGAIPRTSPVLAQQRLLLNEVDAQRRLIAGLDPQAAPLAQLTRRVERLQQLRQLLNVYVDLGAVMADVADKRKALLPDDPQHKIAGQLLQLPNIDDVAPEQALAILQQRYQDLREANIAMSLPRRDVGRYSLTAKDIVQDAPVGLNTVPQEVPVRGIRGEGGEVREVRPITLVRRLVSVIYSHIRMLPKGSMRRQAEVVVSQVRVLLDRIDSASDQTQALVDNDQSLRDAQRTLTNLDRQLMASITQGQEEQEEAATQPVGKLEQPQNNYDVTELPISTSLPHQGGWSGGLDDGTQTVLASEAVTAPEPVVPEPVTSTPVVQLAPETTAPITVPSAPQPASRRVEPHIATTIDADRAMYRTKYRGLLRQRVELEKKVAAKGLLASLTRGSYQQDLNRLNTALDRFRAAHPEVADVTLDDLAQPLDRAEEVAYLSSAISRDSTPAVREAVAGKIMATQKAEAKQLIEIGEQRNARLRAQRYEDRRRQPLEKLLPRQAMFTQLNSLLDNPPGLFASQTKWFDQFHEPERELIAYTFRGEAPTAAQYWEQKLAILNDIRPSVFGRDRWQQEYNSAQANQREAKAEAKRAAAVRASERAEQRRAA